jgi:hypothetical protein
MFNTSKLKCNFMHRKSKDISNLYFNVFCAISNQKDYLYVCYLQFLFIFGMMHPTNSRYGGWSMRYALNILVSVLSLMLDDFTILKCLKNTIFIMKSSINDNNKEICLLTTNFKELILYKNEFNESVSLNTQLYEFCSIIYVAFSNIMARY